MQPDDSHLDGLPPAMRESLLAMRHSPTRSARSGYVVLYIVAAATLLAAVAFAFVF